MIQQIPFTQPQVIPPQVSRPATPSGAQPTEPGEPPLVSVHGGPTQVYRVRHAGETLRDIARKTLGTFERASEILRLNPDLRSDKVFQVGETVYLPADACIPVEDLEVVRPLPAMRKEVPVKPRVVLPLTGTFPANLDDKRIITLPRSIREQLGNSLTVLVSPGPDQCLWLTNQAHLDRLAERLEKSATREADVRVFKRLYFAQTEKLPVSPEGRLTISERLAQFAGLHQEVVLVGIDDHFELWDVARWRQYTQEKSSAARSAEE
jgi:MraZ protein